MLSNFHPERGHKYIIQIYVSSSSPSNDFPFAPIHDFCLPFITLSFERLDPKGGGGVAGWNSSKVSQRFSITISCYSPQNYFLRLFINVVFILLHLFRNENPSAPQELVMNFLLYRRKGNSALRILRHETFTCKGGWGHKAHKYPFIITRCALFPLEGKSMKLSS